MKTPSTLAHPLALSLGSAAGGALVVYFVAGAPFFDGGPPIPSIRMSPTSEAPAHPTAMLEADLGERERGVIPESPREDPRAEGRLMHVNVTTDDPRAEEHVGKVGDTTAAPSLAWSALGRAFPDIAEDIQLDGVPLWQLEVGELAYDDLSKLLGSALALSRTEEHEVLDSIPEELRIQVSREEARRLHAESPESYFVRDPSDRSEDVADTGLVELTADLTSELVQLRDFTTLLCQQPAWFEGA